jgi:hypothetical protein
MRLTGRLQFLTEILPVFPHSVVAPVCFADHHRHHLPLDAGETGRGEHDLLVEADPRGEGFGVQGLDLEDLVDLAGPPFCGVVDALQGALRILRRDLLDVRQG